MDSSEKFQTRSDSHKGKWPGLNHFPTFREALAAYDEDGRIWKISYIDQNGKEHRWRPKMKGEIWSNSESRLDEMSEIYKNALSNELFWVDQKTIAENHHEIIKDLQKREIPEDQWDAYTMPPCIQNVLTDTEFRQMASNM